MAVGVFGNYCYFNSSRLIVKEGEGKDSGLMHYEINMQIWFGVCTFLGAYLSSICWLLGNRPEPDIDLYNRICAKCHCRGGQHLYCNTRNINEAYKHKHL